MTLEQHSSSSHRWRLTSQKSLLPVRDPATPQRIQGLKGLRRSQQVCSNAFCHALLQSASRSGQSLTHAIIYFLVCVCEYSDINARVRGSGPTEAGSALGPDWHAGIVLRGAEQVRPYEYYRMTRCHSAILTILRSWKLF